VKLLWKVENKTSFTVDVEAMLSEDGVLGKIILYDAKQQ
jgi:hypothetical protein